MLARRVLFAAAAGVLVLAGCTNTQANVNKRPHTGDATASVVNGVQQLTVTTGTDLRFHPSTLTVHQGKVRVTLVNPPPPQGGPPHNLKVTGLPGAFVPLTRDGSRQSVTFTAPAPGRYRFVCTIHVAQGQTGVLVVKSGQASGSAP